MELPRQAPTIGWPGRWATGTTEPNTRKGGLGGRPSVCVDLRPNYERYGIQSTWPTRMRLGFARLLAAAMAATVDPLAAATADTVSPLTAVCRKRQAVLPAAGAGAAATAAAGAMGAGATTGATGAAGATTAGAVAKVPTRRQASSQKESLCLTDHSGWPLA